VSIVGGVVDGTTAGRGRRHPILAGPSAGGDMLAHPVVADVDVTAAQPEVGPGDAIQTSGRRRAGPSLEEGRLQRHPGVDVAVEDEPEPACAPNSGDDPSR